MMHSALVISPRTVELAGPTGVREILEIDLQGAPSGLVLVLCAAGGLDADVAVTMNGFAEHGFSTVATDLSAAADGHRLDDEQTVDELEFLLDRAAAAGWEPEQIGIVGYGEGGRAALLGAMACDFGAAVSVSPGHIGTIRPVRRSSQRRTPWLGMFGEHDSEVSAGEILGLYGHLRGFSSAYVSIVTYAAGPGFYRDSSDPAVHGAAFDSWQRTVEWLQLRVAPRLTPLAIAWRERLEQDNGGQHHEAS